MLALRDKGCDNVIGGCRVNAIMSDARPVAAAADVARYFLALACEDGDLITNLKMQKLVYYAYAWTLARTGKHLFSEPIQAWANGPVVHPLYHQLRKYSARPIDQEFLGGAAEKEDFEALVEELASKFPDDVLEILNGVYEQYMPLTTVQLVTLTHSEKPWREARAGLQPGDYCDGTIEDRYILEQFSQF